MFERKHIHSGRWLHGHECRNCEHDCNKLQEDWKGVFRLSSIPLHPIHQHVLFTLPRRHLSSPHTLSMVQPMPLPHVLKQPPPAASMTCTPSQSGGPCSLLIRLCPCPLIDDPPTPRFLSSPPDSGVRVSPPHSFARLSARPPRPRPTRPPSVSSDVTLTPGKARSPVPIPFCLHY